MSIELIIQVCVTIGGYIVLLFQFERRMTRVETHLIHLLKVSPKRKTDEADA